MEFLSPRSINRPASKTELSKCLAKFLTCELKREVGDPSSASVDVEGNAVEWNLESFWIPLSEMDKCSVLTSPDAAFLKLPFQNHRWRKEHGKVTYFLESG